MLEAVLFDLDGTLLQLDIGEFLSVYLKEISRAGSPVVDPNRLVRTLLESTGIMINNRDPSVTNAEAFWADFRPRLRDCIVALEPLILDFYVKNFFKLGRVARRNANARQVVEAALARGLRIVLATNPVFPVSAIRDRMTWAGVEDLPWELITCYEKMHFCKPFPEYYLEIAGLLGLQPRDCMMIGNDVQEDLAAVKAGMYTGLVTDFMVNPGNTEVYSDWRSTLAELSGWLAKRDAEKTGR